MKRTLQHETNVVHKKVQTVTTVTDMVAFCMGHWFTDRIDQLCKELKTTRSKLGQEAGISHATIGKWVRAAEAGKFNPRLHEVEMLARHTGKPVSWFLFEAPLVSAPAANSLAAAREAANRLTKFDRVPADEAWLLMRQVVGSDTESLYFEARAILNSRVAEHRQRSVSEIKAGNAPGLGIKTS